MKKIKQNMLIYVDIDNTICEYKKNVNPLEYSLAIPIKENIQKINNLFDDGHKIVYYTARGSVNIAKRDEFYKLTKSQLIAWNAKFHELSVGDKPPYDLLICDKTKRIEEL